MNGNVTKQGITADLEWMKRVGIGGMQMFDGSFGSTPEVVGSRLGWMTPAWQEALKHAAAEADRLQLEMSVAASGGWSETGGPTVKPAEAMKKMAWSETRIRGPRQYVGRLPVPPAVNGPFQSIAQHQRKSLDPTPDFYVDAKVVAYRVPDADAAYVALHPHVTSSAGPIDGETLMDGDLVDTVSIPYPTNGAAAWLQFEFPRPQQVQSLTLTGAAGNQFLGSPLPRGEFQSSLDGHDWTTLVTLPGPEGLVKTLPVRSYSIPATTATFFRLLILPPKLTAMDEFFSAESADAVRLAEVELSPVPCVNRWQDQAGYSVLFDYEAARTPAISGREAIAHTDVVDLSSRMRNDGTLKWAVPPGQWRVLRMGYSLTGAKNGPAPPEATGLEVDKLSRAHVEAYLEPYVNRLATAMGQYVGKSFRYLLMDSWEAGNENWTDNVLDEFKHRRGYDPTPYLPALVGRVVDNAEVSDRFLWDFRLTLADLEADNHYATATEILSRHGLGLYAEAVGASGDGLKEKGHVSIPMAEFWTQKDQGATLNDWDVANLHEAASAAHIYGKTLVAAESFTTEGAPAWGQSPYFLKPLADQAFALGINRVVVHTSVHQPFVDETHKPGMTLAGIGQHYTRNITWAEQAGAWNAYLSRASYLLQQGEFVADVAYFIGEGVQVTVPWWSSVQPAVPDQYKFDWLNGEILSSAEVLDGSLQIPSGMRYGILVIPDGVKRMTLPIVRKLRDLVKSGATLVAQRPIASPSLSDYPSGDSEWHAIVRELWGAMDGRSETENSYGRGTVYWGRPLQQILAARRIDPDFEYSSSLIGAHLVWIHRHATDVDIYFVANRSGRSETLQTRFRVQAKQVQLWHPDTGRMQRAEFTSDNGHTTVPLTLDPYGSVFVVFRNGSAPVAPSPTRSVQEQQTLVIDGPWQVSFPPNMGAPLQIEVPTLGSLTRTAIDGVKYFSGTVTYTKDIDLPSRWLPRRSQRPANGSQIVSQVVLDLGAVKEIAELLVNGASVGGTLWKPPFEADITTALKPGRNRLQVRVTNLWPNRMIGDLQPGITKTYTWTDFTPYTKDSPLPDSGLLGPVSLRLISTK
jgi:hypothetical protein